MNVGGSLGRGCCCISLEILTFELVEHKIVETGIGSLGRFGVNAVRSDAGDEIHDN